MTTIKSVLEVGMTTLRHVHTLDMSLFTPTVMHITQMLNTLIESQLINSNPDSSFLFFVHIMNENILMILYEP